MTTCLLRRKFIWRYGVSEMVNTHVTAFRRRSILTPWRFGEGPYRCYGVSEKVILTLRRFGEGRYSCYAVSEKVLTHVAPRLRLRCHGEFLNLRGSVPSVTKYNFIFPDTVFWIIFHPFESSTSLGALVFNIPHSAHLVPTTFSYAHWCQVVTSWVRLTKSANGGRCKCIFFS
jgi:hypothetical protein